MTKYKWSFLGLIISIILFLFFLISPLTNFINEGIRFIPAEPMPELIAIELASAKDIDFFMSHSDEYTDIIYNVPKEKLLKIDIEDKEKFSEMATKDFEEWYENVPKRIDWFAFRSAFGVFIKSFYNWNLFWIPIIIFSVLMANYKKEQGKLL